MREGLVWARDSNTEAPKSWQSPRLTCLHQLTSCRTPRTPEGEGRPGSPDPPPSPPRDSKLQTTDTLENLTDFTFTPPQGSLQRIPSLTLHTHGTPAAISSVALTTLRAGFFHPAVPPKVTRNQSPEPQQRCLSWAPCPPAPLSAIHLLVPPTTACRIESALVRKTSKVGHGLGTASSSRSISCDTASSFYSPKLQLHPICRAGVSQPT